MVTQRPTSLKNAAVIATIIVLLVLAATVLIGTKLTTDWLTIWAAVTGIGAFVALAALFTAAIYARAQFQESLRNAHRETTHAIAELDQLRAAAEGAAVQAKAQLEQSRTAAESAAVNAEAQLIEAKRANKAAQDFEKVRLTREVVNQYIALSDRINVLLRKDGLNAKTVNDDALAAGHPERTALQQEVFNAVADCAALYAADVLAKEVFLRRGAVWILIGWYFYGEYAKASAVRGLSQLNELSLLIHSSVDFLKQNQPLFFRLNPAIGQMTLPNPPPGYGR